MIYDFIHIASKDSRDMLLGFFVDCWLEFWTSLRLAGTISVEVTPRMCHGVEDKTRIHFLPVLDKDSYDLCVGCRGTTV